MRVVLPLALLLSAAPVGAQTVWKDAEGHPATGLQYASQGDFGVQQIGTTDPELLFKNWAQPTPEVIVPATTEATRNQPIFSFIIFVGCKAGPDGNCHVTTYLETITPSGKPYGPAHDLPVWNLPPPRSGNMQLSEAGVGLRIENGEPLGKYRVIAHTTDEVAHITLTTEQTLTITEAPLAGGWSAVAAPGTDADTQRAAAAMLAKLPADHAALAEIETAVRQVVAGINYRLTLRLTDSSRWSALVWRKLDGTYQVSDPARVK